MAQQTQQHLMASSLMLILLLLTLAILWLPTRRPNPTRSQEAQVLVRTTFFCSLIPLVLFMYSGWQSTTSSYCWFQTNSFMLSLNFKFDLYTVIFLPILFFVTWSIIQFATSYMNEDMYQGRFFKYLYIFVIAMVILVTADNWFQLLIGWEGVGVMSFKLIGWWYGRANANTASLQAILYNRVGDIGLLLVMGWLILNTGSWDSLCLPLSEFTNCDLTIPLLGLILAAAGKSALFGLHPWLPAAMEGPTPVSALLHSSTMVVAGVFLSIRLSPMMENNQIILSTCLCLGALTCLFASMCALAQNDVKKIVAFSTSSQLGLMMVSIGLGQPHLAFFHVCTHAFFKSMLFLCSGSIIHTLVGEQDIRKMGGLSRVIPLTSTCMVLGSLALMGTPYLAGFYSKDTIIEAALNSPVNAWALGLTAIATSFTAVYSLRIMYYFSILSPRYPALITLHQDDHNTNAPILRLALASIIAGFLVIMCFMPSKTPVHTMPLMLKTLALLVSVMGFVYATQLSRLTTSSDEFHAKIFVHAFLTLLGYYHFVAMRVLADFVLRQANTLAKKMLDIYWLKEVTTMMIYRSLSMVSPFVSNAQKGLFKDAMMTTMFSLFVLLCLGCAYVSVI
uniref:NADH-ubiquinone oxidoreductase chain 5 n=1 Tax=Limnichthys fasciatus TaxID=270600 RepID=A0A1V1FZB6_9TELE|nr:NADH dehydrogenase subunit 5 [Limnichthys fasciatus]BBU26070.1 NADH dehydrogenase subunit 5 [Limnichthys fasciatus]